MIEIEQNNTANKFGLLNLIILIFSIYILGALRGSVEPFGAFSGYITSWFVSDKKLEDEDKIVSIDKVKTGSEFNL